MCNSFESNALQNSNESVKRRLPKKFIDFYTSPYFHDSILLEYHVTKRQTKKNTFFDALTKWKRYDNGETFEIIFKNIIKYNANIDITDGYVEFGDFIAGKFTMYDKKHIKFNFQIYNQSEVSIVFQSLDFHKNHKNT